MIFVETEEFTRNLRGVGIPDEIYRLFQIEMIENPAQGDLNSGEWRITKDTNATPAPWQKWFCEGLVPLA